MDAAHIECENKRCKRPNDKVEMDTLRKRYGSLVNLCAAAIRRGYQRLSGCSEALVAFDA